MDIPTFFLQRHQYLYQSFLPSLRQKLPEEAFRQRPAVGTQPIAWLLWHMARAEDQGLSRFVWELPALYDETWRQRINVAENHYGTSMTEEEVSAFAQKVNVEAVLDYQMATGQRTVEQLKQLDPTRLDEVLDEETVRRITTHEGLASERAQWVIPHYIGKTRGWMLCHMGLTHNFRHFGQVVLVRKMLGYG